MLADCSKTLCRTILGIFFIIKKDDFNKFIFVFLYKKYIEQLTTLAKLY